MGSRALSEYFNALQRLQQGKPERVEKGSPINKDNVAREAGRARGSIRNRPGFEKLITAIEDAQKKKSKRRSMLSGNERVHRLNEKLDKLVQENNRLKSRYMSLLYLNLEMAKKLRAAGVDSPTLGPVVNLEIDDHADL